MFYNIKNYKNKFGISNLEAIAFLSSFNLISQFPNGQYVANGVISIYVNNQEVRDRIKETLSHNESVLKADFKISPIEQISFYMEFNNIANEYIIVDTDGIVTTELSNRGFLEVEKYLIQ